MSNDISYRELFKNDGTNQLQRMLPTLDTAYAKGDERTLTDFLTYIYQLAKEIRFYDSENQESGDWTDFFSTFLVDADTGEMQSLDVIQQTLNTRSDLPPHFVLLLAFLQLFQFVQQDVNGLTQKHLNYYYEEILGINPNPAVPDKVNVVFELAKQLSDYLLPQGTLLDAGKDDIGQPIKFQTDRDIVINKATVASLKTLFLESTIIKGTLIQVAPQADSLDGQGEPFEDVPGWRPFGEAQSEKADSEKNMIIGSVGFAISSPILFLEDGVRFISLSIEVNSNGKADTSLANAFRIFLSGAKGWVEVVNGIDISLTTQNSQQYLLLTGRLEAIDPAIVAFNSAVLQDAFVTDYPVLKLVLNQDFSQYDILQNIQILSVTINTNVTGAKDFIVQNDDAVVNAKKPFIPFSSQPAVGSDFYIGSNEIFTKRLTSLDVNIEWNKLPASIANYYAGYFDSVNQITRSSFKASLYFLANGQWNFLIQKSLFADGIDGKTLDIPVNNDGFRNINQDHTAADDDLSQGFAPGIKNGFLKLELDDLDPPITNSEFEAFGHTFYPKVYAQKSIALSKFSGIGTAPVLPNQPYTPQIKSLSVNYEAEETFLPSADDTTYLFWYLEPFGYRSIIEDETVTVLPVIDGAAQCYIGLANFEPPHSISFLFQIEEGTSEALSPDDLTASSDITWSYLASNQWIDIEGADVLADSTEGFQKSGIIMLAIGRTATNNNTLMPTGLHWIRGRVDTTEKANGASNVSSVNSQAISATLVTASTSNIQLSKGLVAGAIKKLSTPLSSIKKVTQPFASFDGQPNEDDTTFYTRVSERLKHKNRLSSPWDYEHFILQAFPSIFKVRCLPPLNPELKVEYQRFQPDYVAPKAGNIQIIVVPDLRNKNYGDPLEPRCSTVLLREIEDYVQNYTSAFVQVNVNNPVYEEILLDFKVSFMPGKDAGYYAGVLNDDIKMFLSPWAYEEGEDIPFGGKVYKSDLLEFVESRDYVDFVTGFDMYHLYEGALRGGIGSLSIGGNFFISHQIPSTINGDNSALIGTDFIIGSPVDSTTESPVSPAIIVSALQHRITPISAGEQVCDLSSTKSGIGYMIVSLDFEISQN